MAKLYPKALDLDEKRILEIIERSKSIKKEMDRLKLAHGFHKTYLNNIEIIDKSITFYKTVYKDKINNEEQTILALYIIINDDKKLLENYLRFKGDIITLGKYYGVSKYFVTLRLKVYKKIKKYNDSLKEQTNNANKLVLTNKTES